MLLNPVWVRDVYELGISVLPEFIFNQINIIFIAVNAYSFNEEPVENLNFTFYDVVNINLVHLHYRNYYENSINIMPYKHYFGGFSRNY